MKEILFRDIEGIKVGNAQNIEAATGCTVVICEKGASIGVDVRGGAPGTRETDLIDPVNLVQKAHAVVLAGGSAFGLDAASGVMQYLEERGIGFDVAVTKVPIVPAAVLFDLNIGSYSLRPDKAMGYEACLNAEKIFDYKLLESEGKVLHSEYKSNIVDNHILLQGNIGAGTGATVGKILGAEHAMKGGLGSYSVQVGDLKVGAIVAVNCLGDVIDPRSGKIVAGVLNEGKGGFADTEKIMLAEYDNKKNLFSGNTTIGIIVTNAVLTKSQSNKIASMAHDGYGRTMRPAHSMYDGDTIFTMATGKVEADISVVGLLAAKVMEEAVLKAVKETDSIFDYRCFKDMNKMS